MSSRPIKNLKALRYNKLTNQELEDALFDIYERFAKEHINKADFLNLIKEIRFRGYDLRSHSTLIFLIKNILGVRSVRVFQQELDSNIPKLTKKDIAEK